MPQRDPDFAQILAEIGNLPEEMPLGQSSNLDQPQELKDSLQLTVQAQNNLRTRKNALPAKDKNNKAAQIRQKIDEQGNRLKISVTAQKLADDSKNLVAWETPLNKKS